METKIIEFELDDFQKRAIGFLKNGISVVVSAPTGSGKTAIAEFVIEEALKTNERVFYTTPLKALSNQKFQDFRKKFGEKNVGILTGDIAISRNAQILVMTTEIYRNMLYGTLLGSVDENLKNLKYLVLDECHYMNDRDRGTVWEESIIYSPKQIQILALSATIANAKELTEWISSVHSKTELIESFERPVPLRFYYFKDFQLIPLLTTDKKLNPNLKEHRDSFKSQKQKFKDLKRLENKRTAKIPDLVKSLHEKALLSGIYFVFSRKGCNIALKECQSLGYTLLTHDERKELSNLIQKRIYGNEYLFKHRQLDSLYQGMAVHHAGLLPQWKSIVEDLFSKGLIKIVFATETLAAGINMPAKTTVISSLGKHGDLGHKGLTSNEFLQMSGRAGRRGMDKVGNVVVKESMGYTASIAAKLATGFPDPLESQFTPNYAMALNLLQRHTPEEIKVLLNKSFGQYLINKDLKNLIEETKDLENKLAGLIVYPCPDPARPGDIKVFRKQDEKLHEIKRTISILNEQGSAEVKKYLSMYKEHSSEHENFPCHPCPKKDNCSQMEKKARKTEHRLKEIEKLLNEQGTFYWNQFFRVTEILKKLGYIKNNIPTEIGLMAGSIRGENIILISEVLLKTDFSKLEPGQFAACISSLAIDSVRPRTYTKALPSFKVDETFIQMGRVSREVFRIQRDLGINFKAELTPNLAGLVELWCKKETIWADLLSYTNLDEGDIVRSGRRTMDLLRHIKNAPHLNSKTCELARHAFELMDKEPVRELL